MRLPKPAQLPLLLPGPEGQALEQVAGDILDTVCTSCTADCKGRGMWFGTEDLGVNSEQTLAYRKDVKSLGGLD